MSLILVKVKNSNHGVSESHARKKNSPNKEKKWAVLKNNKTLINQLESFDAYIKKEKICFKLFACLIGKSEL